MDRRFSFLAIIASVAIAAATPVQADETGLAGIHTWRAIGSKTCFVDHFHDGSGNGPDQRTALHEAIKSWESFTDLEYGSDWGSYANSVSKTATCNRGMSDVSCQISSIPCKGGVLVRRAPKSASKRVAAHGKPAPSKPAK